MHYSFYSAAACGAVFQAPAAGRGKPEIFAQGLAGVILVKQPAALQFRHDVADEIRIRAWHIGRRDDKAVAAAADEHLFQFVGDLLRPADDRVRGLAAAGEGDKIARAGVGLARGLEHAVADAEDALHALEFFSR